MRRWPRRCRARADGAPTFAVRGFGVLDGPDFGSLYWRVSAQGIRPVPGPGVALTNFFAIIMRPLKTALPRFGGKGDAMQRRFTAASLVLLAGLSLSLIGCGKVGELKAKKAFKEANQLYTQQEYKRAADKYKEAVDNDPNFTTAYFYLANSYDNMFKATKRGDATNDAFLTKAIENYKIAADKDQDPKMRKLALQYLVNAYGTDKMNDPGQAVPIIEKMIQIDPQDTDNYFALAKMYEDAGQIEEAEKLYLKAKDVKPNLPVVYGQLAGFYNRQGEFDKTIAAFHQQQQIEPNNPEVYYTTAAYYWDKSYHDTKLKDAEKRALAASGIEEVDKALKLKPDYIEALVSKGLLIRLQAGFASARGDKKEYDRLMSEAQQYTAQADALNKKRAAGK
jgi:tetratricopeptide (TPR) repeat protein